MATAAPTTADIPKALKLPTKDDMKARFRYIQAEVKRIEDASGPLRAKRDELVNQNIKEIQKLEDQYLKLESDGNLFDLKMEASQLVTLLRGDTRLASAEDTMPAEKTETTKAA